MNATPTSAKPMPIASNGHLAPVERAGTSRPAAKLTASVVRPVRHHARYVRSFASRVLRVASRASSKLSVTPGRFGVGRANPPSTVRAMPLQNRVTPLGELIADPARGLVYGNRGCLHDAAGRICRHHNGKRW